MTSDSQKDIGPVETPNTIPHLPDEVIANIIPYLQQPLPRPTGKNERSSIRQNDLATCMRLFNNIAAPLLYSTIVTDHLPSLVNCCFDEEETIALGIEHKFHLLQRIQRLYLEYDSKETPSYSTLLRHGGHYFTLIEADLHEMAGVCALECDWIAMGATRLAGLSRDLLCLATGAFLGGQREIWYPVACEGKPKGNDFGFPVRAGKARTAITTLFTNLGLAWFCQRVEYGPLVFEQTPWPYEGQKPLNKSGPSTLQHRSHFELDCGCVPVIMGGGGSRWYCPYNSPDRDPGFETSVTKLTHWMTGHLQDREAAFSHMHKEDKEYLMAKDPSLNIDIYLPKSMTKGDLWERVKEKVQEHKETIAFLIGVPDAREENDIWKVHRLEEAPPCEACGWQVEDMDAV